MYSMSNIATILEKKSLEHLWLTLVEIVAAIPHSAMLRTPKLLVPCQSVPTLSDGGRVKKKWKGWCLLQIWKSNIICALFSQMGD